MYYTTADACSCPAWLYRPDARPCKHVQALRDAYTLIAAQREHNERVRPTDSQPSTLRSGRLGVRVD